jgi:soluble lytic murein transglycosylase-like protein
VRARRRTIVGRTAAAMLAAAVLGLSSIGIPANAQDPMEPLPARNPIAAQVAEASQRFGIPEAWIYAVMGVESAGDQGATSPKGAMGLMQVMPGTYADLRARYGLGANPYYARDNILAGTAYLREMYDRYGSPGFLAAYNAGPGRYENYLAGRPLPGETRTYLARLGPAVGGTAVGPSHAPDPLAWTRAALFAGRWGDTETAASLAVEPRTEALSDPAPATATAQIERPIASLFVPLSGRRP